MTMPGCLGGSTHLDADTVGSKVLAKCVTCIQQGLPVPQLLLLGIPAGRLCVQRKLPHLQPEAHQLIHHAAQGGLTAVS